MARIPQGELPGTEIFNRLQILRYRSGTGASRALWYVMLFFGIAYLGVGIYLYRPGMIRGVIDNNYISAGLMIIAAAVIWIFAVTFFQMNVYLPGTLNSGSLSTLLTDLYITTQPSDDIVHNFRRWIIDLNIRSITSLLFFIGAIGFSLSVIVWGYQGVFLAPLLIAFIGLSLFPLYSWWRLCATSGLALSFIPRFYTNGLYIILFSTPLALIGLAGILIALSISCSCVYMVLATPDLDYYTGKQILGVMLLVLPVNLVFELMNLLGRNYIKKFFTNRRLGIWS